MNISDNVYYRKIYFSFVMPSATRVIAVYAALLKGKQNVLVDCGVSYSLPDIQQMCADAGISLDDVNVLINTHCHADHTGGNAVIRDIVPDIKIWAHPAAIPLLADKELHVATRPVPYFRYLMKDNVTVDKALEDGEVIGITGYPMQIIYTPGHSKDSISIFLPEESILLAGDAIINMEEMPFYEDASAMYNSLEKLRMLNARYVLSAFNGLWDMREQGDFFALAKARLDSIHNTVAALVASDRSLQEISDEVLKVLGINMPASPLFMAAIKSHMELSK